MAKPPPSDLPRLKRFANLEFDGVEGAPRPPKPAAPPPTMTARANSPRPPEDADERFARGLAADLTDNARTARDNTRAEAMRQARAADLRRARPADPVPTPAGLRPSAWPQSQAPRPPQVVARSDRSDLAPQSPPQLAPRMAPPPTPRMAPSARPEAAPARTTATVRSPLELRVRAMPEAAPQPLTRFDRDPAMGRQRDDDELFPPDMTPGVMTIEIGGPARRSSFQPMAAPRARAAPPIEVTPLAARQILLMAWQSGMQGSGLRIFLTRVPGLGGPELDFAFDDHPTPDDVVFESNGVRIVCDSETLAWARGRRITFHDVPTDAGIGAFRLA